MRPTIGIISDTHGLLRPEAVSALQGVARIIHAGDIGSLAILQQLATIAPVTAVRGNNDKGDWAATLPNSEVVAIGSQKIYVVHDIAHYLDGGKPDPRAAGCRVVISGHSHRPSITERDGVLFVNPGSAGPRRFKLPVSVAVVKVEGETVSAELRELNI